MRLLNQAKSKPSHALLGVITRIAGILICGLALIWVSQTFAEEKQASIPYYSNGSVLVATVADTQLVIYQKVAGRPSRPPKTKVLLKDVRTVAGQLFPSTSFVSPNALYLRDGQLRLSEMVGQPWFLPGDHIFVLLRPSGYCAPGDIRPLEYVQSFARFLVHNSAEGDTLLERFRSVRFVRGDKEGEMRIVRNFQPTGVSKKELVREAVEQY